MSLPSRSLFPAVLARELRAAARRSGTYWIRVIVVTVALGALLLHFLGNRVAGVLGPGGSRLPVEGAELFALLHTVLSAGLLMAAPLFAADCIARERRDGTLELLALTPLNPFEIVLGKAAAQIVRLLSLWIACLPVLLIPLLSGGVGVIDLEYALGIEFMIVLGGLAAGLVATSFCRAWSHSAGLALALTLGGGQFLTLSAALVLSHTARALGPGVATGGLADPSPWIISLAAWMGATGLPGPGFGTMLGSSPPWVGTTTQRCLLGGIAITGLLFGVSVLLAGWRVGSSLRQDRGRTKLAFRPAQTGTVRASRARSERRRQRWLAGNPARWLCASSGTSRWGAWGWLAFVAASWLVLPWLARDDLESYGLTCLVPIALAIPLAMTAAASFRRELEEGTLELLLVTPLPARMLVWARVREQWSLFGPAAALQWILTVCFTLNWDVSASLLALNWAGLVSIVTLPAIGIRYAVRRLHPLNGFFWSLLTISILPFLIGLATMASISPSYDMGSQGVARHYAAFFATGFGLSQLGLSLVWGWLAARDLETRWYLFRPFQRRVR